MGKKKATDNNSTSTSNKQKKYRHVKKKNQKHGERKSVQQQLNNKSNTKRIENHLLKKKKKNNTAINPSTTNGSSSSSSTTASTSTTNSNNNNSKISVVQATLEKKLAGAKFRMINEQLYTKTGAQAKAMFDKNPELFREYHDGFRSSIEQWPFDPVSNLVQWLKKKPKSLVVADFGCGEARIAQESKQTAIHSFDLVAMNDRVTVCDIAHVPLDDSTLDIGIFSLSLMGTNFLDYLKEAYRVLKPNAILKIVELESRFAKFDSFKRLMQRMGFDLKHQLNPDNYFVVFEFVKNAQRIPGDTSKIDPFTILKPCLYKNR
jgi:hypothetical protein